MLQRVIWCFEVLLAFMWAIPWTLLGLLLIATFVLWPAGVACLTIGAYPLKRIVSRHIWNASTNEIARRQDRYSEDYTFPEQLD